MCVFQSWPPREPLHGGGPNSLEGTVHREGPRRVSQSLDYFRWELIARAFEKGF